MNCFPELPDGYNEIFSINLQKDKKAALKVNGLALGIALILCIIGHFIVPISALFDFNQGLGIYNKVSCAACRCYRIYAPA